MALNPLVRDWRGERVWVVGASTGIGAATARLLLERGARVALTARSPDKLAAVGANHARALAVPADVTQVEQLAAAWQTLRERWGGCDRVLFVAGTYQAMRAAQFDLAQARGMVDTNIGGLLNLLDVVLPDLLAQRRGAIAIVASVAGYRGLPKALVYGPTKAALINLAESLYLDLRPFGIGVHLICPGFVATPLTASNDFRMPALITPEVAAQQLVRGLENGAFETHFPKRFTLFLKLLRRLPYAWYFRLVGRAVPVEH